MALIQCPKCGNEMEDNAKGCMQCGYKKEKNQTESRSKVGYILSIAGLLFSLPIAWKVFEIFYFARMCSYAKLNLYIVFCAFPGLIASVTGFGFCFAKRGNRFASKGIVFSVIALSILIISILLLVGCFVM